MSSSDDPVLKVGVYLADQNPKRDRSLGITRMSDCLLRGLSESGGVELNLICTKGGFQPAYDGAKVFEFRWNTTNALARVLTDSFHPRLIGRRVQPDVWLYPKGYLPLARRARIPRVIIVHDTILQWYQDKYPWFRSRLDYAYWLWRLRFSIRHADSILAVSETAKAQILALAERFDLGQPKIDVIFEASEFEERPIADPPSLGGYAVHLASTFPHKKTLWLLETWEKLQQSGASLPPLKLIGTVPSSATALVERLSHVERLPRLEEAAFVTMIAQAGALILPSEIEGFGLPALEAWYFGTPVVFAEGSSVEEIMSGLAFDGRFSLSSPESLERSLARAMDLSASEVSASRAHLKDRFSIKKFAATVYHRLLERVR